MDYFEIEECLNSMSILVDTREQPNERAFRRYETFGVPYSRHKLDYGDYAFNFILNGKPFFEEEQKIYPPVVIERKENLAELSGNLCQNRERFEREFQRARENGAKIYLLVEDASWENLINGKYRTKFHPKAFTSSLLAFMARYEITPIFCKSETSGQLIKNILYRELKERLVRGDYG